MSDMQKEMTYVSDLLDQRGVREGVEIAFRPLLGRKQTFVLNRTRIDFLTEGILRDKSPTYWKMLDSLEKEKLHYVLKMIRTIGRNKQVKQRYLLKTITGSPFRHNQILTNEAFLEEGDRIEMGHNELEIQMMSERKDYEPFELSSSNMKVVQSDLPIVLSGETGSGKTTLAKKLHELSRPGRPFIHLNISSFASGLLESELFGHVKGAFTGALKDRDGALVAARDGTLFLDEIDSLPKETQTKLLIFLDEFKVRPVGSNKEKRVACRLICASGTDLKRLVKADKMRSDFYYRIASGLSITLPSLRDENELVANLCQRFALDYKVRISENLMEFYQTLPWPGNIRQLFGHLQKKLTYSTSRRLDYDDCDEQLAMETSDISAIRFLDNENYSLEELKCEYVKNMYFRCGQNAFKTAKKLSISPRSVRNYLEKSA